MVRIFPAFFSSRVLIKEKISWPPLLKVVQTPTLNGDIGLVSDGEHTIHNKSHTREEWQDTGLLSDKVQVDNLVLIASHHQRGVDTLTWSYSCEQDRMHWQPWWQNWGIQVHDFHARPETPCPHIQVCFAPPAPGRAPGAPGTRGGASSCKSEGKVSRNQLCTHWWTVSHMSQ